MKTYTIPLILFGIFVTSDAVAHGQGMTPLAGRPGSFGSPGPTVSPYLQLTRPGGTTFLNYYGLVRPAFEIRGRFDAIQSEVSDLQSTGIAGPSSQMTGSNGVFLNTGNYFLNSTGQQTRGGAGTRLNFSQGSGTTSGRGQANLPALGGAR